MLEWIALCGWQLLTYKSHTKMLKPLSKGGITYQNHIRFNKVSGREELYQYDTTSFLTMVRYIIIYYDCEHVCCY